MSRPLPGPAGHQKYSTAISSGLPLFPGDNGRNSTFSEYLNSKPWQEMCKSVGLGDPLAPSNSPSQHAEAIRTVFGALISDILEGMHDLRVARMVCIISGWRLCSDGACVVELRDPSGTIDAFLDITYDSSATGVIDIGSVLILENVSLYVSKQPFRRYVSVTASNIRAVFSFNETSDTLSS